MHPGQWSMQLVPSRPQQVWETIDMFGHIFVLEAPVNARLLADAGIKSMARWAGYVRHKTDEELIGTGLIGWLGDDNNKGRVYLSTLPTGTNGTFLPWVRDQILAKQAAAQSITIGTGTDIATPTYTGTIQYWTPRQGLDFLCNWFGGEYKVLPDGTLNCGKSSDTGMFVTTPKVVLLDAAGGRDLNIKGVPANLTVSRDVEDYATQITVHGAAGYGSASISPTTTYKDLLGNLINLTQVVEQGQATAGQEATVAAGLAKLTDHVRVEIRVQTDQFNVPADIAAGDSVAVYDVPHQLYDLTNPVRYRGRYIFPVSVRCYGMTWPFEQGYSIYYRDLNGVYTDLTPWIAWEAPGTTLEVGAPMRIQ
jgi:hypothetical protein